MGPLGPRGVADARSRWWLPGPTWWAPPHLRCHVTDPCDFTCVNIQDVEVKSISSKGRKQVSHGLWFFTTCNKCFQHVPNDLPMKQTTSEDDLELLDVMSVQGRWRPPQDPGAHHSQWRPPLISSACHSTSRQELPSHLCPINNPQFDCIQRANVERKLVESFVLVQSTL